MGTATTTVVEGFEITDESDETDFGAEANYYLGTNTEHNRIWKMDPSIQYNKVEKAGQLFFDLEVGNSPLDNVTGRCNLVNGIPFYLFYGKATHTTPDSVQTIVNATTSETRKRLHILKDIGSCIREAFGVVILGYEWNWKIGQAVGIQLDGKGCKHQRKASHTLLATTFPSGISTEFIVPGTMTWNSEALDIKQITCGANLSKVSTSMHPSGYYRNIVENSTQLTIFTLYFSTTSTNVDADFAAKTARTLVIQMKKADGNYFTYTCPNARIISLIATDTIGTVHTWMAIVWCENVSIEVKDDVDDSFYE